jgi:hypothetical protein
VQCDVWIAGHWSCESIGENDMTENHSLLELLQRIQVTLERIEGDQDKMTPRLEEIGQAVAEIHSNIQTLEKKLLRPRME